MAREHARYSRNRRTNRRVEAHEHRRDVFHEVLASHALKPISMVRQAERLDREAGIIGRLLGREHGRGETTQAYAQLQVERLREKEPGAGYYAQNGQVKRLRVKPVRRKEIDTDKLAMVFWMMAKRQVAEKRAREAELQRNQLSFELDEQSDLDQDQWLGLS
jgi:hypothetical protein